MNSPKTVQIVGCGLIGTSIGMGLVNRGWEVHLRDLKPENEEMAAARGAGEATAISNPDLVIIAVNPHSTASLIEQALAEWPNAVVTDVASVKSLITDELNGNPEIGRYVGSHPMAGSERSGPLAASGNLFQGRPWAVCAHSTSTKAAVELVELAATDLGATLVHLDPQSHDLAVAMVSHVPHVMATLTAAQLIGAEKDHLALAGPGLRDVTRIAASDPVLWQQILKANSEAVGQALTKIRADLDVLINSLASGSEVEPVLSAGRAGTSLLPGRHGGADAELGRVFVQVADKPGELQRLMAATAAANVNIEDIRIDHELGREVGIVEVTVRAEKADALVENLLSNDWTAYR